MTDDALTQYISDKNHALNYIMMSKYTIEVNEWGRFSIYPLNDSNFYSGLSCMNLNRITPITFESEKSAFNWLSYFIETTQPKLWKSVMQDMKRYKDEANDAATRLHR